MIPRKIHYCWFGGNPLSELAVKCIASWKKYCPDYELIEWNESNFDVTMNDYVAEAYRAQKWAFITDYVRLYAMVNCGGVYMDTDVEVTRSLDSFLDHIAFSGFETPKSIPTGIMASVKDFPLFKTMLCAYDKKHFIREDGSYDITTNVHTITKYCLDYGLVLNNRIQCVEGFTLYPNDYFCPKDVQSGKVFLTENTYAIHHFSGSWNTEKEKKWHAWEVKMCQYTCGKFIISSKPIRFFHIVYISGLKGIRWKLKSMIGKHE